MLQNAREHAALMERARERLEVVRAISDRTSDISVLEVAAGLQKAMGFFGESDEAKIAAMLAVFSDAPHSDVVEIGVLTGRSAAVLAMMARCYRIGPVLEVDLWSYAESIQHESPSQLQSMVDVWDARVSFETFLVQLTPIARHGTFNYLPMTSLEAHWYLSAQIFSPEFGGTRYSKNISVLHIDGNHDFAAVNEDVGLWLPNLRRGGWLILDDYFGFTATGRGGRGIPFLWGARTISAGPSFAAGRCS